MCYMVARRGKVLWLLYSFGLKIITIKIIFVNDTTEASAKHIMSKWIESFLLLHQHIAFTCCHSFYPNSNTVHTHRLQRSHQPISDRLQKHLDHYQYGVTELLQRVAQEEARGRRWLRCFMMGKYKRCFWSQPASEWEATSTTSSLEYKCCCSREAAVALQQ